MATLISFPNWIAVGTIVVDTGPAMVGTVSEPLTPSGQSAMIGTVVEPLVGTPRP